MARSFNGSTESIDVGVLTPPSSNLTVAAWINSTLANAYDPICCKYAGQFYTTYVKSNGKLAFYTVGDGSYDGTGTLTVSANTWTHTAFTVEKTGNLVGYMNGSVDNSQAALGGGFAADADTHTTIGLDGVAGNHFPGNIADVAVWNATLTQNEIIGLARGMRPYQIRPLSLTGYWPIEGLSSPEPDLSGNLKNGTLTGTAYANGPPITMFTPRWRQLVLPTSGPSAVFRKTASRIGTRTGSRQTWAA